MNDISDSSFYFSNPWDDSCPDISEDWSDSRKDSYTEERLSGESYTESGGKEDCFDSEDEFGYWDIYVEDSFLETNISRFKGKSKVNGFFTHLDRPIEFFQLFLSDEFIEQLCNNTHDYYEVHNNNSRRASNSHKKKLRNVCFYSSNDTLNLDDPIYKIRSLVSQIVFVSQKLYSPGQFLTTDEGMIKFNGEVN